MCKLEIGRRLKEVRQNQNLTLDEVAKMTKVSKPMLGQIERGQSSPTVNTLWKIATGLKTPFSYFLQENQINYTFVDIKNLNMISEENGAMRAFTYFPFDPIRRFEVFYIEFDAGCAHHSSPHNDGVEEYIFVVNGKLDMVINETKITLLKNQALRFDSNVSHAYLNPYDDTCCIYNTIFYK